MSGSGYTSNIMELSRVLTAFPKLVWFVMLALWARALGQEVENKEWSAQIWGIAELLKKRPSAPCQPSKCPHFTSVDPQTFQLFPLLSHFPYLLASFPSSPNGPLNKYLGLFHLKDWTSSLNEVSLHGRYKHGRNFRGPHSSCPFYNLNFLSNLIPRTPMSFSFSFFPWKTS